MIFRDKTNFCFEYRIWSKELQHSRAGEWERAELDTRFCENDEIEVKYWVRRFVLACKSKQFSYLSYFFSLSSFGPSSFRLSSFGLSSVMTLLGQLPPRAE